MDLQINRRAFFKTTALDGLGMMILENSRSAYSYEANEKLNVALIGVGGRGSWFVNTIPKLGTNVVAMCDVNDRKAEQSFKEIPQAKKFSDFRKMLNKMNKNIDVVIVATPDHTHAVATAAAGPRFMLDQLLARRLDWGDAGEKKWRDHAGCLLIGTKGMIHSTGHNMSFTLLPEKQFKDFEGPTKTLPRTK